MFAKIARAGGPRDGLCLTLVALGLSGCASAQNDRYDRLNSAWQASARAPEAPRQSNPDDTHSNETSLDRAAFIRSVLERNPTVEASRQAWRAALAAACACS